MKQKTVKAKPQPGKQRHTLRQIRAQIRALRSSQRNPTLQKFSAETSQRQAAIRARLIQQLKAERKLTEYGVPDLSQPETQLAEIALEYLESRETFKTSSVFPTIGVLLNENDSPASIKLAAVSCLLNASSGCIVRLARSNHTDAIRNFLHSTVELVEQFQGLCASPRYHKTLVQLAKNRLTWPMLVANKQSFNKPLAKTLSKLRLGENSYFSKEIPARLSNEKSNKHAMERLVRLEEARQTPKSFKAISKASGRLATWREKAYKLRPFSIQTWEGWADVVWKLVMEETHNTPEANHELRLLGHYRKDHYETKAFMRETKKTEESNIRDGIKNKLREAVRRIARSFPRKM